MPQNTSKRSDMWWRGHNDALAGDPPNESYFHYYYDYKLGYQQAQRDLRRSRFQRFVASQARYIGLGALVIVAALALGWYLQQSRTPSSEIAVAPTATSTPRPTPRPTLAAPTATLPPSLRVDGFAKVNGTDGAPLRGRSQPGTKAQPIVRFREGQIVRIVEGPQPADGYDWWRVEADGASGWTAGAFLEPVDPAPSAQ